jgi:hypothetical protein
MLSGHRSARRRRSRNSRAARIAVPLAIPMALGLTLGIILAVSGGRATTIDQSALGSCASPNTSSPAAADPTTSAPASPSPAQNGNGNGNGNTADPWTYQYPSVPAWDGGNQGWNGGNQGWGSQFVVAASADPTASTPAPADPTTSAPAPADPTTSAPAPADATTTAPAPATTSAPAPADPTTSAPATTAPATTPAASPSPCASGAPTTNAVVPPAATFASGQTAFFQLGDLATDPVDGTGAAINLNQTAAQAATSMNCTLTVPNRPLTAQGLATPYQLGDGCTMQDAANEGAFVEATILAPNGSIQVYNPLVVTAGTTPAVAPVAPTITRGSQVIIDIGSNGNNLVLEGRGARQGNCVDALGQSVIGQVSACNAVNFYRAANAMIAEGFLQVPALGTSQDGQTCESVRNFALIDQDQSDNVISTYLLNASGQTAQDTAANAASLAGATPVGNGSDDRLLADFVDPANGCSPFTATDSTAANGTSGAQALNELSARVNQTGTIAAVPTNDEMTLVGNAFSIAKTNVYRSLVDQPLLASNVNPATVAADYCQNLVNIAPAHNQLDFAKDANFASPVPGTGDNLGTFLGARLSASFGVLGCANFGLTVPVTVTVDGNGVANAATYNLAQQTATGSTPAGGSTASASPTPSGMPTSGGGGFSWGFWLGTQGDPGTIRLPRSRRGHHEDVTGM